MSKNNNRYFVALMGLVFTIIGIIWASAKGYGILSNEQTNQGIAISQIKTEGCIPARKNTTDIAVIKQKLETIQITQVEGFKEILKRLPEN